MTFKITKIWLDAYETPMTAPLDLITNIPDRDRADIEVAALCAAASDWTYNPGCRWWITRYDHPDNKMEICRLEIVQEPAT